MNLSSVSAQLNMSVQELRDKARQAGFGISPRANKIDNYLAKKLIETFSQKKEIIDAGPKEPIKVSLPSFIKVRDLSTLLNIPVTEVIKTLIKNGVMATINEEIDFDTAAITVSDLGFEIDNESVKGETSESGTGLLQDIISGEQTKNLLARPPIVAVMGHVDHGKTTLLDAIRRTKVAAGESGGITQHIGAYSVEHSGKTVTFLDTPGHEAFSEMRARGANVTDIIVLVVAADDGVRPQTVEVINRAKFTNTPTIVAINKIDKENANPMKVKQELAEYGILTEEWGGKTIAVELSAKQNKGIDTLLEMILLVAEMENFQANPNGKTVGTVIESHTQMGLGPVATVIVQNGTLNVGDIAVAGQGYGKIKTLQDETGKKLKFAGPSTPVQVGGLSTTPEAGDVLQIESSVETAKAFADNTAKKLRSHKLQTRHTLQGDVLNKNLNLLIKADVAGSLEAITGAISKLRNDEVKINILSEGVGEVNESDILLAEPSGATILAFRAKSNPKAINLAKLKKVNIDNYEVIYELIENVTSAVVKMFAPEYEKVSFGRAKILQIFRTEKGEMIIGGQVNEGEIRKNKKINITREDEELGRGEILELQQSKIAAKDVSKGNEFGMKVKTSVKLQVGDTLESFEENLKQKSL